VLRKLLLKVLLERAIAFEEGAYRFYEGALERAAMSDTSELLKSLLAEELRHRMKLEEAQRTGDISSLEQPGEETDGKIEELTALMEIRNEWPAINPWAGKKEILEAALAKEAAAFAFYRDLASGSRFKALRDLFSALSREEEAHAERLKEELGRDPE
jgi:rubrerythrin